MIGVTTRVFFSVRISLRNDAFSDDIVDHEFESLVITGAALQPIDLIVDPQLFEITLKIPLH